MAGSMRFFWRSLATAVRLLPPRRTSLFMSAQFAGAQVVLSTGVLHTEAMGGEKTTKDYIVYKKSDNPEDPVIVLFGWAGCQDRYLTKYSQIYENKGYSVVRYTPPIIKIRGFHSYPAFAQDIYEHVLNNNDKHPVVFHVFSMNGCSLFVALWDMLTSVPNGEAIKKRVKGIVFDSCPANVMPWQASNAISFATLPPSKYSSLSRNAYRMMLTGFISSHRALVWLQSMVDSTAYEKKFAFFRLLKMNDLPQKQLYLYSNSDDICSDHSIEGFANLQKDQGKDVTCKCWNDSLHVEHWRAYPEEYSSLCDKFITEATDANSNNLIKQPVASS